MSIWKRSKGVFEFKLKLQEWIPSGMRSLVSVLFVFWELIGSLKLLKNEMSFWRNFICDTMFISIVFYLESTPLIRPTFWKHSPPTVTPSNPQSQSLTSVQASPSLPVSCLPAHGVQPYIVINSKNTGVSCHALLQGIFLTQGSNLSLLHLLHWQAGSLSLLPPEKP